MALIDLRNMVKVFPPAVVALGGADLQVEQGRVHAIIGENGAGKTTLMRALYGLISCEQGAMYYRGEQVNFPSPHEAVDAGIGMVHQEFMLIPSYRVIENIILGAEPRKANGRLDWALARAHTTKLMERYGIALDLDAKVSSLSVSAQQKLEILKLLCREVDVLILDEPTAVLTPQESAQLFQRIRLLTDEGKTVIFISHKLDEVLEISDDITVMRKGRRVDTLANKGVTRKQLASMMVGREVIFSVSLPAATPGEVVLEMRGASTADEVTTERIDIESLVVRRGEIVGVAGLEGSGQQALVEVLIGLRPLVSGSVHILGQEVSDENTIQRRRHIAYVAQDRRHIGTCQQATLTENAIMTHHRQNSALSGGWRKLFLKRAQCGVLSQRIIDDFDVRCSGLDQEIANLSGGNQQKIIVGREFGLNRPFVLLDQPTRGLDVGSIEYIQQRIIDIRGQGYGCLLVSADLDELQSLSDRLLVLHEGKVVAEFGYRQADRVTIGQYMLGVQGEGEDSGAAQAAGGGITGAGGTAQAGGGSAAQAAGGAQRRRGQ